MDDKDVDKKSNDLKYLISFCISVAILFIIFSTVLIVLTWPISELSVIKAGTFGDSFGVLTSLFSGLAFAGIISTILLQRKDLALTREELRESRIIADRQATHFENQAIKDDYLSIISIVDGDLNSGILSSLPPDIDSRFKNAVVDDIFGVNYDEELFDIFPPAESWSRRIPAITNCVKLLTDLSSLLKDYEQKFKSDSHTRIVSQYYVRKYGETVRRLNKKGYVDNSLVNEFNISYDSGFGLGFGNREK